MVVCSTVFMILLLHDIIQGERDERKVHFDNVLIAHTLYFVVDCFWASVIAGAIPRTTFTVLFLNYVLLLLLSLIASTWFTFTLASTEIPWRRDLKGKLMICLPMAITSVISLIWMIVDRSKWIDEQNNMTVLYQIFFLAAPVFYIISGFVYSMREAFKKKNILNRNQFLLLGIYPITVMISGIVQILVIHAPFFCFNSMIMIILFNLLSMQNQISVDPLTRLNNRGELMRYAMQEWSIHKEGMRTFVVMLDANDFKKINDTYGHVEGDHALIMIADALKKTASEMEIPPFIARYGGDEFVMLIHVQPDEDIQNMAGELQDTLNTKLAKECSEKELPYTVAITVGIDELEKAETFQESLVEADNDLYRAKKAEGVGR